MSNRLAALILYVSIFVLTGLCVAVLSSPYPLWLLLLLLCVDKEEDE